jgi:hypothetical protein
MTLTLDLIFWQNLKKEILFQTLQKSEEMVAVLFPGMQLRNFFWLISFIGFLPQAIIKSTNVDPNST